MNGVSILRRVPRLTAREIGQFVEAASAITVAWVAIRILPFRRLMHTTHLGRAPVDRTAAERSAVALEVRRAVKRAARRLPWEIVCFPEAMAAHWMLRRRGALSKLHYGLRSSDAKLSAHVWVTLDGEIVVGEEGDDAHNCVAVFPREPSA